MIYGAIALNQGDGTVSVINTSTNTVTATITVGSGPIAFGNFIDLTPFGVPSFGIISNWW